MKFYVSGGMRGYPQSNFPAFNEASERLKQAGYDTYNPAENIDHEATDQSFKEEIGKHITQLMVCDAVAVLPAWTRSEGAKLEVSLALAMGKDVYSFHVNRPKSQMLEKIDNLKAITRFEALHEQPKR
jgi:hypothetical protein